MGTSIKKTRLQAYNYFELGINQKIGISAGQMTNVKKFLNTNSINADFLFNDQSEYLITIKAYPFYVNMWFNGVGASALVPIGPFSANETQIYGRILTQQKEPQNIGSFTFNRYYDNFLDFAPHTQIHVYLPFIGFREINVNEVMGKSVDFYAQVDFDNGILSIWMECNGVMLDSWENQIGVDVAISRTNQTDLARNLYTWSIGAITGVGSAMLNPNVSKAVALGGQTGISFINANQHHVYRGGIGSGINELYNPTSIYIIISRDIPEITDLSEYRKLYGLPCRKTLSLSDLHGYTKVGDIHLENFNTATSEEKTMIENELKNGVIL